MRAYIYPPCIIAFLFLLLSCGTENKPIYNFTATASPEEGGTITPSFGQYEEGKSLEVTASPTYGWEFVRWEGDLVQSTNPKRITINKEYNVIGVFERAEFPLTIAIEGEGEVKQEVLSTPKTMDYTFETVVQLTPIPSDGWRFVEWNGDIRSSDEVVTVKIDGETNVIATFERLKFPLSISIEGQGEVNQEIISTPKTTEYPFETVVQLSAVPDDDWFFFEWSGDISDSDEVILIEMDKEKHLTATFITTPQLSTASISKIAAISARSGGNITDDGGSAITSRGICWSTTQNPTTGDNCTKDGSGTGSFTSNLTNLTPLTWYYVRAFAKNSAGTAYGSQKDFQTSDGIRDTNTSIVEVTNPATGRTWMDRNLGASRRATSSSDTQAYGDLFQWGRAADGHQRRDSKTTRTPSNTDRPGHDKMITVVNNELHQNNPSYDWRIPRNDNLWQGSNGTNNPCPVGFRIPTEAEWEAERQSWSSNNSAGAYSSPLRLPTGGYRIGGISSGGDFDLLGSIVYDGSHATYASATVSGSGTRALNFNSGTARMHGSRRATGTSVRCIKE